MRRTGLACILASLFTACGGASDPPNASLVAGSPAAPTQPASSTPTPCSQPVEGPETRLPDAIAGGTIAVGVDPSFILVVLGEQRLLFYGPDLPTTASISGFVFAGNPGPWCSSGDPATYNGIDRNFRLGTESRVYLYTTVKTNPAELAGSIRYPNSTYGLTGGPIPGSSYDGTAKPSLADAIGSWIMTGLDGTVSPMSINDAGLITGSDRGCPFSGTVAASSDEGANLLRVQLEVPMCTRTTFDFPYEGFAVVLPMKSGGARLLLWANANNGVDSDYILGIGNRN